MKRIIELYGIIILLFIANTAIGQQTTGTQVKVDKFGFPQPEASNIAPDFLQHDANGKPIHLSDFKGKFVLLDFWGSMCAPCRASHPHLIQVYNKYKDKNFTILSVSTYDMPQFKDRWLKAIATDKLVWTQVSDPRNAGLNGIIGVNGGKFNSAAAKYGVTGLPRNFLIDPAGIIIATDLRGAALDEAMEKYVHN